MRLLNAGDRGSPRFLLCLCSSILLYIFFRFWGFADQCLWFDEIFSVHAATQPISNFFYFIALDIIHPPLFYLLLKFWISIGGESLNWLRAFPVVLSILAIFPFFMLCRELRLRSTAVIIAMLLFATNGTLVKYAQEVRMYAVVLLLALFSLWLFTRFFNLGKNIWTLTLVNVLLVYTHYFGAFLIIGEILAIICFQRIKLRQIAVSAAISLATLLPWLIFVYVNSQNATEKIEQNIGWMTRPGGWELLDLLFSLVEPFYFRMSSADPLSILPISLAMILLIKFTGILAIVTADKEKYSSQSVRILPVVFAFPLVSAFLLSWLLPQSVWGIRHFAFILPVMCILLGWLVTLIENRPIRYGITIVGAIIVGAACFLQLQRPTPQNIWCGWETAAQLVAKQNAGAEKKIVVFEDLAAYHAWFAVKDESNIKVSVLSNIDGLNEDKAFFLPRGFSEVNRENDLIIDRPSWLLFRKSDQNKIEKLLQNKGAISQRIETDQGISGFEVTRP